MTYSSGCTIGFYCSPSCCSRFYDCPHCSYEQNQNKITDPYGRIARQRKREELERAYRW